MISEFPNHTILHVQKSADGVLTYKCGVLPEKGRKFNERRNLPVKDVGMFEQYPEKLDATKLADFRLPEE